MKDILVPIDFSSATKEVVDCAVRLAKPLHARVCLMNVVVPQTIPLLPNGVVFDLTPMIAAARKSVRVQLLALAEVIKARKVAATIFLTDGFAVGEILRKANKLKALYLVIGSHGHGELYELVVGSTTHGLLRKAPCPVIVVPSRR